MLEFEQVEVEDFGPSHLTLLTGEGGLFPGGTRVFPSKYHFQRRIWLLFASGGAFTVFCLLVAILGGFASSSLATIFSVLMVLGDLVLVALFYVWNKQDKSLYHDKVEQGLWLEGVFIFSTGDIVIRFNTMLHKLEMEFDSGSVTNAMASDSENKLIINYTDILSGIPRSFVLDCSRIIDRPTAIAEVINSRNQGGDYEM